MKEQTLITNIQKFSVRDGPGIRSIIFFKGCPLSCQWCANPENISFKKEMMFHENKCIGCNVCIDVCNNLALQATGGGLIYNKNKCALCGACVRACSTKAREIKGEYMDVQQAIKEIDTDIAFYKTSGGGVTFSGGEPLLNPDFIKAVAKDYKEKNLSTAVETCGYVPWENIETVKDYIDLFLYDVKFADESKHIEYCGKGNKQIIDNLKKLSKTNNVIVRIPIVTGINDSDEDIRLLCNLLDEVKDNINEVNILPYHNFGISKYDSLGKEYKLSNVQLPDEQHMRKIKEMLESAGLDVQIGG